MLKISYTDTNKIRSVIGLSEDDTTDEELVVRDLELELDMDLASWIPNLESIDNGSTANDEKLLNAIGLYSTYFCARLVVPSLQMAAIKQLADGKNVSDRFSPVDWDKLFDRLSERVAFYKKFIMDNNATDSTFIFRPFTGVGLAVDPVTG